ncbi:hypothetical protein C8Q80DRAFT_1134618 [Daedaleopsis nitida]|nr:hypothetical protein C8Q80DRAFT_1134618 [Daedaleopsis nitida]
MPFCPVGCSQVHVHTRVEGAGRSAIACATSASTGRHGSELEARTRSRSNAVYFLG